MKGRWILALASAAALVAPEPGFAALRQPPAASSSAEGEPSCVPPELRFPGSGVFEPVVLVFDLGSAKIDATGAAILKNAANTYRHFPKCVLMVNAYTDGMEAASHLSHLDARRGKAVVRFLRGQGVTMPMIIRVFGDGQPNVETPKGAAEPRNRCVDLMMGEFPSRKP